MKHLILLMIVLCTFAAKAQMAEPNLMEADSQTVRVYLESHGWKIQPKYGLHIEAVNSFTNEYVCFVFINGRCSYIFGMYNDPMNFGLNMLLNSGWRFVDGEQLIRNDGILSYSYDEREASYRIRRQAESYFHSQPEASNGH